MARRVDEKNKKLMEITRDALRPVVDARLHGKIRPRASLVKDLGMDSLKVVELTINLEAALGRPVFLPDWIASVQDPSELTVDSLVAFLSREP